MKDQIKAWLKAKNHTREWLGEQIGVKPKTVDNWLSSPREIPSGKLTIIERLMQEDEAAEAQRRLQLLPTNQIFSLEVDLPRFRAYSAAALANDQTLEQWAIAELNAAAEAAMPAMQESQATIAGTPVRLIEGAKTPPPPNITHISGSSSVNPPETKAAEEPRDYRTGTED